MAKCAAEKKLCVLFIGLVQFSQLSCSYFMAKGVIYGYKSTNFLNTGCFFLVRFCPYLLYGGLYLLTVNVDGDSSSAALCHKPVVCGRDVSRINQIMRHD